MSTLKQFMLGLAFLCGSLSQAIAQPPENPRRLEAMGTIEFVGPLATTVRIDGKEYRMGNQVRPCRLGAESSAADEKPELQRGQTVSFSVSDTSTANTDKQVIDQICVIARER